MSAGKTTVTSRGQAILNPHILHQYIVNTDGGDEKEWVRYSTK